MNRVLICFIALYFFNTSFSKGQKSDSSKIKALEMTQGFLYYSGSDVFKKNRLFFKTDDDKYILPWEALKNNDPKILAAALDTVSQYAKLKTTINGFGTTQLELQSHFPVNSTNNDKLINVKITQSKLKDSLNQEVKLNESVSTSYGVKSYSSYSKENNINYKWQTLNLFIGIDSKIKSTNISGSVTFKAEAITGYNYVKITKNDIGKEFVLKNQKFKVIDIWENKVVLSPVNTMSIDIEFKYVNMNDNSQQIKSLSFFEFNKLKDKDSTITYFRGESMTKVYKKVYDQFKKDSTITYENFSKNLYQPCLDMINNKDKKLKESYFLGPKYTIIVTAGPIENLYLYLAEYGVMKEFEVKL